MTTHVTFAVQESEKARMEASAAKRGQTLGEFVATSMIEALDMEVSIEALVAGAEEDFGGAMSSRMKRCSSTSANGGSGSRRSARESRLVGV